MRLCRILRSAVDSESGGGLLANEQVMISRSELDELRLHAAEGVASKLDPSEKWFSPSEFAAAIKTREVAHARELEAREKKLAELEQAYKSALLDRELATALVGKPLVPGAAPQLIKLWRDDFEVVDDDGEIRILARDGRGVDQAVGERLSGADFAHFCLPSSRGGTGSKGQNRSAEPGPRPAGPKNLGEAVLIHWREAASRPQATLTPAGWGRRR